MVYLLKKPYGKNTISKTLKDIPHFRFYMFFQSSTQHSEVRLEMSNIGKTEIPHVFKQWFFFVLTTAFVFLGLAFIIYKKTGL